MWTAKNRRRYDRSALRYPSDLTDDEWAHVESLIPPARRGGQQAPRRRARGDERDHVCVEHGMPVAGDSERSATTQARFSTILICGATTARSIRIHHALYVECREQGEREASPTAAIIDSQSVKSAEGGPASIRMAMMRAKRSRARSAIFS